MSRRDDRGSDGARSIKSVERFFDIVEHLEANGPAGVTEVAREVGLAKSTVHLHVQTMYERGYAIKEGREYDLSLRFLDVGLARKFRNDIYEVVDSQLVDLANRTGEQVWFWVEENGLAVVVSQALGARALSTNGRVGDHLHMHCTAGGKAILAHLPASRVDEIVERHGLEAYTDRTITDRAELEAVLREIRERGLAVNRGESIKGVFAIAVPVVDNDAVLHGSISIAGPSNRMADPTDSEPARAIADAANELAINLSYV